MSTQLTTLKYPSKTVNAFWVNTIQSYTWDKNTKSFFMFLNGISLLIRYEPISGYDDGYRYGTPSRFSEIAFNENITPIHVKITDAENNILIDWADWNDIADDIVEFPSDYLGVFHVEFRVYFQDQNGDGSLDCLIDADFEAVELQYSTTKEIITIEPSGGSFTIGDTEPIYNFLTSNYFRVVFDDDSEEEIPVSVLLGGQFTFQYIDTTETSQTLTYTYPYEGYKMPSSAKIRTPSVNGKLSPTVTFKYSLNGVETTKSFVISDFYVNGIASLFFNRLVNYNLGDNYLDATHIKTSQTLYRDNLEVFGTDGFGNTSILSSTDYEFIGDHTFVTTQATAGIEQETIVKVKDIRAADGSLSTYVVDNDISYTFELKVTDISQKSLYVEPLKTTYRVGNDVTRNDFNAWIRYYVDGTLENDYLVEDFNNMTITPNKILNSGIISISVRDTVLSITATYNVNAIDETDRIMVVDKTPTEITTTKSQVFRSITFTSNKATLKGVIKLAKNERLVSLEFFGQIQEPITQENVYLDNISGSFCSILTALDDGQRTVYCIATIKRLLYQLRDYGELETDYNMNIVLDGSTDTTQIKVFNHQRNELKPYTIVFLGSTGTWWVVKKDISRRYASEDVGLFVHTIALEQCIEVLNARDNANSGYYKDRYTLGEMLEKLSLVNDFELPIQYDLLPYADSNKNIDYLKTFENYTPLSAIKEVFRGLNLEPKGRFEIEVINDKQYVNKLVIYPLPKSGINTTELSISYFDSEEETLQSDKASYGTRVVSNVQNCVSPDVITYPIQGSMRLTSHSYEVDAEAGHDPNYAVLRLPSNIYEVKRLIACRPIVVTFSPYDGAYDHYYSFSILNYRYGTYTLETFTEMMLKELEKKKNQSYEQDWYEPVVAIFMEHREEMFNKINNLSTIIFENGGSYDPITETYTKAKHLKYELHHGQGKYYHDVYLNSVEYSELPPEKFHAIYWEQGKNEIKNFTFIGKDYGCYGIEKPGLENVTIPLVNTGRFQASFTARFSSAFIYASSLTFVVEYIPMSDLKLKIDNDLIHNDTKLYNQNGKLVDSYAVSRLVNSHAKEVSSSEISREKRFYDFNNIPSVGQVVDYSGTKYVINNISLDIHPNDNGGYVIDATFNMTEQVACKSIMISANTNIRDYEIPQKNNIERTSCFKDYIEFLPKTASSVDFHYEDSYNKIENILNFGELIYGDANTHEALIKVKAQSLEPYSPDTNGAFCYHIGCVRYNLNKTYIDMVDFKDNNIIGYEAGQSLYVFQVSTMLQRRDSTLNTPITYVDDFGELDSINVRLCNGDQLETEYLKTTGVTQSNIYAFNRFVSFPYDVYEKIDTNSAFDIALDENDYRKDGLEVPRFEYICQVGDSNGVVFGDNFLKAYNCGENEQLEYYFHCVDGKVNITPDNATLYMSQRNTTTLTYDNSTHLLSCSNDNLVSVVGKTIVFYRIIRDTSNNTVKSKEFMFAYYCSSINSQYSGQFYVCNWKIK